MKVFLGGVEVDENFFGPARRRGQTERLISNRTTQKQPVFGIYKRGRRVYTEIVPDCSKKRLHPVVIGRVDPENIIYSDDWRGYDWLVHVGYDRHIRINKRRRALLMTKLTSAASRRSAAAPSVASQSSAMCVQLSTCILKECEWRYRNDHMQLENELKILIRKAKK